MNDISDIHEGRQCRALWASVLLQAIKDMDIASEAEAARFWMYRDPSNGVGSFSWICSILDLDEARLSLFCTTRAGRWRLLGPHHAGQNKFKERKQEASHVLEKIQRQNARSAGH